MGSDKKKKPNEEVTYYDVAAGTTRTGKPKALASKSSTKDTVNLCIHERKGLSIEMFFLILAAILLVLLVIEYFCAYRPYVKLEAAENEYVQGQKELDDLRNSMSDEPTVREEYRKRNYEKFPRELVDREDVFDVVESLVFDRALITSYTLRENVLTLGLRGSRDDLTAISADFMGEDLVDTCTRSTWTTENGQFETTLTITFAKVEEN